MNNDIENIYRARVQTKGPIINKNVISESMYVAPKRVQQLQPGQKKPSEPRSLGGIYGQKVAGSGRVLFTTGNDIPKEISTRDPQSMQLESHVNKSMMDALKSVVPNPVRAEMPYKKVAGINYEDAIKELAILANQK